MPVSTVMQAQTFRRWYQARVMELFPRLECSKEVDAVLLPATPCAAPQIGQERSGWRG